MLMQARVEEEEEGRRGRKKRKWLYNNTLDQ